MIHKLFKKKCRCIEFDFEEWLYIPKCKNLSEVKIFVLEKDEVEALRLVDGCNNSQADAAKCMGISSSTIQRILEGARRKIIKTIVHGNALQIKGGNYVVKKDKMLKVNITSQMLKVKSENNEPVQGRKKFNANNSKKRCHSTYSKSKEGRQ